MAMFLLGGRGGAAKPTSATVTPRDVDRAVEKVADDITDGAKLVARANQSAAQAYVPLFEKLGAPTAFAHALARWAGIESSGHPETPSKLGERGLMQISRATALQEKAITQAEWDALGNPKTSAEEQARIGLKLVAWLWKRASKYVTGGPTDDNYTDRVWFAKLYHQRPIDVRDGKLHGPAAEMARELAQRWANDKKKMHYLRAANVVAWGTPNPP